MIASEMRAFKAGCSLDCSDEAFCGSHCAEICFESTYNLGELFGAIPDGDVFSLPPRFMFYPHGPARW